VRRDDPEAPVTALLEGLALLASRLAGIWGVPVPKVDGRRRASPVDTKR
jgi:hypothetical protein